MITIEYYIDMPFFNTIVTLNINCENNSVINYRPTNRFKVNKHQSKNIFTAF